MPRAGRQRQRDRPTPASSCRGGYLDFGHGRRRRPAPPRGDGRRDRRSIAAARDRRALGVGRAQRATAARAEAAGLADVGERRRRLRNVADVILSVCPPHAARRRRRGARRVPRRLRRRERDRAGDRARASRAGFERFVDGGIVAAAARRLADAPLSLRRRDAQRVAALFAGTNVDARVVSDEVGARVRGQGDVRRVDEGQRRAPARDPRGRTRRGRRRRRLLAEWRESIPGLEARLARAERSAQAKGWRWVGEMEEIAATFAAAGAPDGFHRAAAEVYPATAPERTYVLESRDAGRVPRGALQERAQPRQGDDVRMVAQPVHGLRAPLHLLLRPRLRAPRRPAVRRPLRALDPREGQRRRRARARARAADAGKARASSSAPRPTRTSRRRAATG